MQDEVSTTIRSTSRQPFNPKRQEISLELPAPAINHEGATSSGPFRSHAIRHLITKTLFAVFLCTPLLHAEGDAYKSNPKFTAAMAEAQDLTRQRNFTFAIDAYKKACKIANNQDPQCLEAVIRSSNQNRRLQGRSRYCIQPDRHRLQIPSISQPPKPIAHRPSTSRHSRKIRPISIRPPTPLSKPP